MTSLFGGVIAFAVTAFFVCAIACGLGFILLLILAPVAGVARAVRKD